VFCFGSSLKFFLVLCWFLFYSGLTFGYSFILGFISVRVLFGVYFSSSFILGFI